MNTTWGLSGIGGMGSSGGYRAPEMDVGGSLERVAKLVDEEVERNDPQYNDGPSGCDRFELDVGFQGGGYDKDYEKDEIGIEFSASGMVERIPEAVATRLENMEDICFYGLLNPLGLAVSTKYCLLAHHHPKHDESSFAAQHLKNQKKTPAPNEKFQLPCSVPQ